MHGSFHDIAKTPALYMHPTSIRRIRVFLMMGATIGNIENEPAFFRNLAACAQPGDLAVLDCQTVRAPADQPELIRQMDINAKRARSAHELPIRPTDTSLSWTSRDQFASGTVHSVSCPWQLRDPALGGCRRKMNQIGHFLIWQNKRYDLPKLGECLLSLGWSTVQTWKYGPEDQAVLLFPEAVSPSSRSWTL